MQALQVRSNMTDLRNGFLIVASVREEYVKIANFAANSIKDNYPEAHVTLFIPPKLLQYAEQDAFDLIVSENVPDHVRTKLYALSHTPYTNLTVYVDADMECVHTDVQSIWNEMPSECDILITNIRPYNGKLEHWPGPPAGRMVYHGGFFMYRSNAHTLDFMKKWWVDYEKQRAEPWPYLEKHIPAELGQWDQFTFWKLLNIDMMPVNVQVFKDDARWNFVNGYRLNENKAPIVFYHHTVPFRADSRIVREMVTRAELAGPGQMIMRQTHTPQKKLDNKG